VNFSHIQNSEFWGVTFAPLSTIFRGRGCPQFSLNRIITCTGLRYLNSVVIFSIGFPFPFKVIKVALYFYSTKLKVESKYLYLTWCAFEQQVRRSSLTLWCRRRNRAIPKSRGKLAHLSGHPAKPHSRPTMSCGLPAMVKFLSGPHNSTKYVVILGFAVMVGKLW
jgi:hypothetical protein